MEEAAFRRQLLSWYDRHRRDLPWRLTKDPYRIWVSEVMLQQTRVSAVIPYYERFLARFPDLAALAAAPEEDLLHAWAGLGYYSRVRNLQRAARASGGKFPKTFAGIRDLPGIGDYTAAAIASIAFGLPHASVDGNVIRVAARLSNDEGDTSSAAVRRRLGVLAQDLLDPDRPGDFNQAMMELGATVCLPRQPLCLACPVEDLCEARKAGTQQRLPFKATRSGLVRIRQRVLVVRRGQAMLFWQRPPESDRLAGFWELPEPEHLDEPPPGRSIGEFRHFITNHAYTVEVLVSKPQPGDSTPACKNGVNSAWIEKPRLSRVALSTAARKALHLYRRAEPDDPWNAAD